MECKNYDILKQWKMKWNGINILGISELRWIGIEHIHSEDYTVYYSGQKRDGMMLHLQLQML